MNSRWVFCQMSNVIDDIDRFYMYFLVLIFVYYHIIIGLARLSQSARFFTGVVDPVWGINSCVAFHQ